jgi:hypothetical protein
MFSLSFERSSLKISDKKVGNPTMAIVRRVLENAGMNEGEWKLRIPHRIRQKRCERFKAIRLDYSAGSKGIRIRCKPGGNDTSFEYTLVPPPEVDMNVLYHALERVHPNSLEIHDTVALAAAIFHPELREAGIFIANSALHQKKLSIVEEKSEPHQAEIEAEIEAEIGRWASCDLTAKAEIGAEVEPESFATIAEAVEQKAVNKISDLRLDEPADMDDQEVLDKALIALSFVMENGYARKNPASSAIIENLDVDNFTRNISGGKYASIPGAMRALTMALRAGQFLDRVYCSSGNGGFTDQIRGYKITSKGEKRINALKPFLAENLIAKMRPNWARGGYAEQIQESQEEIAEPLQSQQITEETDKIQQLTNEELSRLKSWIASLEEANVQIQEVNIVIENLTAEKSDLDINVAGISAVRAQHLKQKEEIDAAMAKLDEKEKEIKEQMAKKDSEIKDWLKFKSPYVEEKEKLELQIASSTGRIKI